MGEVWSQMVDAGCCQARTAHAAPPKDTLFSSMSKDNPTHKNSPNKDHVARPAGLTKGFHSEEKHAEVASVIPPVYGPGMFLLAQLWVVLTESFVVVFLWELAEHLPYRGTGLQELAYDLCGNVQRSVLREVLCS